ncbi:YtpR family tRNA-binding protein [Virgibacillus soli]|uniref:DUF4479 domain-containing protein n=1 Tax=Paracerasibacillus soli TaxID=480284 RepID=A0ABU5CQS5_9BACI|nr:DUF4479 domain-containing protein [Virgibacillus soli]MDY0408720.1 DUF4479 domain-containing protein [Virgibacillus soli]
MNVFYNQKGIGDVLIVPVKDGNRYDITEEAFGPITKITTVNGELLGYNIFQASTLLSIDTEVAGSMKLTEELIGEMKQLFEKNGLTDPLDFDLSPKFVVGYVKEKNQHENADKLSVCQVDVGSETLQIVCGAPNVDKGQRVVVAKVGAVMPSGLQIKPTSLRGVASNGMICSQKELGLPNAPEEKGIYVLEESYEIGQAFEF